MSVDDRLRVGLAANAGSVQPEGEARLAAVRRRHRHRRALVAGAVAAVVLVVGCGAALGWMLGGQGAPGGRGADVVDSPSPTRAHPAGAVIPPSNWRRVVTREQLVRAGADDAFLREHLGSADRLPLLLALSQDVFSQSGRYAGGWRGGDAGRVSYDDQGRLVLTSSSTGCFRCVLTFDWRIEEPGELLLSDATGELDPIDRVMYAGSWRSADG
jgi:hypothetical protein